MERLLKSIAVPFGAFLLAFLLIIVLRSSILQPFTISSESMLPTLQMGDDVFVAKFMYGVHIPWARELWGQKPWFRRLPKRGDMIVFRDPKRIQTCLIKRVIGLPGDKILIQDHKVILNGTILPQQKASDEELTGFNIPSHHQTPWLTFYRETLSDTTYYAAYQSSAEGGTSFGPITIPKDHIFVLGDNRDFSSDSRTWGPLPVDLIEGQVIWIWSYRHW